MRYTILALLASCAMGTSTEAEQAQGLVCDPDCDPAGAQYVINQVLHWGSSAGWTTTQGDAGCQSWVVVGGYEIECYATFENSAGHRYLVDCSRHPSGGGVCTAVDACDQFGC